eukprot:m.96662 g.96662  ORF g.96662 m.96662 type:complete len:236 (+) comp13077_c0_seq1:908-1615(+)
MGNGSYSSPTYRVVAQVAPAVHHEQSAALIDVEPVLDDAELHALLVQCGGASAIEAPVPGWDAVVEQLPTDLVAADFSLDLTDVVASTVSGGLDGVGHATSFDALSGFDLDFGNGFDDLGIPAVALDSQQVMPTAVEAPVSPQASDLASQESHQCKSHQKRFKSGAQQKRYRRRNTLYVQRKRARDQITKLEQQLSVHDLADAERARLQKKLDQQRKRFAKVKAELEEIQQQHQQ